MLTKAAKLSLETVFRALSDRTRLRILNLLQDGEICVCDLVDVLDVPQPTASRHLAYLRKAGLVLARKEGLWHYYRLDPSTSHFHEKLLECLAACDSWRAGTSQTDRKRWESPTAVIAVRNFFDHYIRLSEYISQGVMTMTSECPAQEPRSGRHGIL